MLEILQTRKKRIRGKRIDLEGQFVYSTQEVLDIYNLMIQRRHLSDGVVDHAMHQSLEVEMKRIRSQLWSY